MFFVATIFPSPGIIDILQGYTARKSMETAFKGITGKRSEISCVPPDEYSSRFLDFMDFVFQDELELGYLPQQKKLQTASPKP